MPSGLLWATCNVGANSPEEYGDYFAWGEVTTKETYNWSTYKYGSSTFSKYNTSSSYGTVDNKTVLDPEDDAAHVNWDGDWRMPTKAEQDELRNNCTWNWTDDYNGTGTKGYIVTSNAEGNTNSIFLPTTGYRYDSTLSRAGSYGYFWSSSLSTSYPYRAYSLSFNSGYYDWKYYDRFGGRCVRAVCSPK